MVWGGKTAHGRTPLVVVAGNLTGMRYQDGIVQPYVIPFIQAQTNNVTFRQDNARPHVARVVHDYLTQQNVDLLPWPAVSSDLSPIEHVWDEMERRLRHLPNQPVMLAEMGPALIRIWNNIPQAFSTTWLDQCVAVAKHALLQMMDTKTTDFVNVQRAFCCLKRIPNEFK